MSRTAVQIACTNPVALSHPWPEALGSISSQAALDNVHCADPPTSVVLCARMSQDFVRAKISAEDVRSEGKHMWLLHSGTHRSKHVFQLAMVIIVQASTCSEEWLCNRNTRKGIQVAAQAVRRSPAARRYMWITSRIPLLPLRESEQRWLLFTFAHRDVSVSHIKLRPGYDMGNLLIVSSCCCIDHPLSILLAMPTFSLVQEATRLGTARKLSCFAVLKNDFGSLRFCHGGFTQQGRSSNSRPMVEASAI